MIKKPKECSSLTDVRFEIDRIDKQIIDLLGERLLYVREVAEYKSSEEDVPATTRYNEVLTVRKQWASEKGLDPVVIEEVYKTLIASFIAEQMSIIKSRSSKY